MKTEVLRADFSEIYRLYHDGKLTNYKDVPFQTKEKQEALQYIENVANYLTGTPWKGQGAMQTFRTRIAVPEGEILTPRQQQNLLKNLLKNLSRLEVKNKGRIVVAVDIDLQKELGDSVRIHFLTREEKNLKKTTNCPNWNYIFPYGAGNYTINQSITYFWVGPDSRDCETGIVCSPGTCFPADFTFEHAASNMHISGAACSNYYVNVETFTYTYYNGEYECTTTRGDVQQWINSSDSIITNLTTNNPSLQSKKLFAIDMYHHEAFWCAMKKGKRIYTNYAWGECNNTQTWPWE